MASARGLAVALGAVAVVAVIGTTVGAATQYAGRDEGGTSDEPPPPDEPDSHFEDGQVLFGDRRDNAQVDIPSEDDNWKIANGEGWGFGGDPDDSDDDAFVRSPAVFHYGFCSNDYGNQARAVIGFSDADEEHNAKQASAMVAEDWRSASIIDSSGGKRYDATPVKSEQLELADGTEAWQASTVVTVTDKPLEKCQPPRFEVSVIGFDTGDYVASLVIQRDLDVGNELSDEVLTEILQTLKKIDG